MDTQRQSLAVCHRCQRLSVRFDDRHRPVCREHDEATSFGIAADTPSPVTHNLPEGLRPADQEHTPSTNSGNRIDESGGGSILPRLTDSQDEPRPLPVTNPSANPANTIAVGYLPKLDDRERPDTEPDESVESSHAASHIGRGALRSQLSSQPSFPRARPRVVRRPLPSQSQRRAHS